MSCFLASAGTVNTVDFDDFCALGKLKQKYNFWLHIDGAFGAFAACSPDYAHLVEGVNFADSITVDAHKWLNVPYDAAMQFSRHPELQLEVFQNYAPYLGKPTLDKINFVHLTPENSRRFRALPAWMSLVAYGKTGYREIIERNCAGAKLLGEKLAQSSCFALLSPVNLNTVCFTLECKDEILSMDTVKDYLEKVSAAGHVFLTASVHKGKSAIRASISNWQTEEHDIEIAFTSLQEVVTEFLKQLK